MQVDNFFYTFCLQGKSRQLYRLHLLSDNRASPRNQLALIQKHFHTVKEILIFLAVLCTIVEVAVLTYSKLLGPLFDRTAEDGTEMVTESIGMT